MAENRRDEQKLWLILFQIKGVRSRLNFLVVQRWFFTLLAFLAGAVAVTLYTAAVFGPMTFIAAALAALVLAVIGIVRETSLARAARSSPVRAAAVADERTQMKGRLTTVLALADASKRSSLWPYLIEDTYRQRMQFEPSRVVPQWLSRAIFPLLAALAMVALAVPLARFSNAARRIMVPPGALGPGRITADLDNLEVLPADPALRPNAEIYTDPATLKKLADKLNAAGKADRDRSSFERMMRKARRFADAFQDKLNGVDRAGRPLRLQLTDRGSKPGAAGDTVGPNQNNTHPNRTPDAPNGTGNSRSGAGASSGQRAGGGAAEPPTTSLPGDQADQLAARDPASSAPGGNPAGGPDAPGVPNGPLPGGGASHGAGSDPGGLFGAPSAQPLGSDSFKIAIEAEPSNEATAAGSPTYVPPRVRVPLNSDQYPDQPLARTEVPAVDHNTIKRVFQR